MNNMIVLDLETARSADDCKYCNLPNGSAHPADHTYTPIGWNNKPMLGLSIGGYYDYTKQLVVWFDETILEETLRIFVDRQPLMVSFNGISFDFPLMRGILRRYADTQCPYGTADRIHSLCDRFKILAADSYDILAEIWRADPSRKFERGLNSLDAIAQANGLGPKLSHGAQAPRDWAEGEHTKVIKYCQDDILKTRALFEILQRQEGKLLRGDGSDIHLRWIDASGHWHERKGG